MNTKVESECRHGRTGKVEEVKTRVIHAHGLWTSIVHAFIHSFMIRLRVMGTERDTSQPIPGGTLILCCCLY